MVLILLLSTVCLLACVNGQTGLSTFDEAKTVLRRGGLIVVNIDSSDCITNVPFPEGFHQYITMPFRDWTYYHGEDPQDEFIRGNDFFVQPSGPVLQEMVVTVREMYIRPDNTVNLLYRAEVPVTEEVFEVTSACVIGRSARIFEFDSTLAIDNFYSYREVREALLLGRHVEAITFVESCQNSEQVIPSGGELQYGHRIENFALLNDGTSDESLVFYHTSRYPAPNNASEGTAWVNVAYVLNPDETIQVSVGVYESPDFTNNLGPALPFVCRLGTTLQFSSYRDKDISYITYSDVKSATLKGHEMELILFPQFCDVLDGPEPPTSISGHRFDQFKLEGTGSDESLTFTTFAATPNGTTIADVATVRADNTVQLNWYRWDSAAVPTVGLLSCSLQGAALFHSISRERGPVSNYVQIMRAIKNEGAIFEIEINLRDCLQDGASIATTELFGGVLWETSVTENAQGIDTEFLGILFNVDGQGDASGNAFAWSSKLLVITPDNVVNIYSKTYDFDGADITVSESESPYICKLNTGGPEGSVYFYRYP